MRKNYIVTYDICDPKRLRRVFKTCKNFGIHLQLSVFECDLNDQEKIRFETQLRNLIHHDEDQILFIHLGPTSTRGERTITSLGLNYSKMDLPCFVV